MRVIDTAIEIDAAPAKVWEILMDFDKYEKWNPFILRAEGEVAVGNTIKAFIRPPGDKGMTHQPTIVRAEPGRHLQWLGKVPGLLKARHEFILEPVGDGTKLRHREEFSGIVVPFLGRTLHRTEAGFQALNEALKVRAEQHERTNK